MKPEKNTK